MDRRSILVAAVGAVCTAWLAAAAWAELPAGWSVHTFTGRIHEIEPAGGVLACATDGGLLLFDPATQTFAPAIADAGCNDGNCLASNRLTSISRDANGSYWMGTVAAGVVVFRPAVTGRRYGHFFALNAVPGNNLLADSVRCIEAWRAQTVYVGTSQGVAQIDLAGALESHNDDAARRLGSAIRGSVVRDLAVDSVFVWVATDSGLSRYDRTPPYATQFLPDSLGNRDAQTVEILGGTVYAGTGDGVYTWQEASHAWRRVRNVNDGTNPTPSFVARTIARLPDGRIYAATNGTVWFFNRFAWGQLAPPPLFLLGNREFSSVVTTGDTAWTCQHNADGEGAFLEQAVLGRPSGTWQRFTANALPPSEVKVVDTGADGSVWIGTRLGGAARLGTDGRWCTYNGNDPTVRANMTDIEGHVSALAVAIDGRAWFHALPQPTLSNPVDLLRGDSNCDHTADQWDHIAVDAHRFGGRYWRARRDGEGNLYWLADGQEDDASDVGGGMEVVSADGTRFTAIRPDTLGARAVGALAFDTTSGAWSRAYVGLNGLGTHGLRQWIRSGQLLPPEPPPGPQNFSELALPDDVSVSEYRDLAVVPGTRIVWVATDNGVFEYDATNRAVLTTLRAKDSARPGLLAGDVKALQFDRFGNLWVATVKGLNRIRLDQRAGTFLPIEAYTTIETIRELNAASAVGQLYDPRRAIAPLPSSNATALAYDTGRDRLYCATEAGVAVVDVAGLSQRTVTPVDAAVLYPNPVRADAGHHEVRIGKLSEPATVTIYNMEGEEVCSATDREDGDVVWTLGTPSCLDSEGNFLAASGAYLVRITTRSGSTTRTLVVIR